MNLTLEQIRSKKPCESGWKNLLKSLPENAEETSIAHLLASNGIEDTLWTIFNCIEDKLNEKQNMLTEFALLAVEEAEKVLPNFEKQFPTDLRVREALLQARAAITNRDEALAWSAAESAESAAESAAWSAAWSAARSAAESAESAARSAAWSAAWSAARSAAWSAAWSAARSAAWSAARSAESAARSAAEEMQEKQKAIILKYFNNSK